MRLTAKQVSERLASTIETLCNYLYPNGKRIGNEWCIGSTEGEEGKSLKIQLGGGKAGLWADFAGSASGDALDLFAAARGLPMTDAIKEAKKWLGVAEVSREPVKQYDLPKPKGVKSLSSGGVIVSEYLSLSRKLTPQVIKAFKITHKPEDPGVVFPYFNPEGKLVQIKWIGLKRKDGKKRVVTGKNCAPALFGWQAMDPQTRSVIITEGEIDAMTWATWGFPALSVPFGAKNLDWIEYEWENLDRFDDIYLSFDMDEAGREPIKDIVNRLGMHRCKIVHLPQKDANDWLVNYSPAIEEIEAVLAESEVIQPIQFINPTDYVSSVMRIVQGEHSGIRTELFEDTLRFREGETTIWTGYPGHGKTTLLSQFGVEIATKGNKVAIASMEMPIAVQIMKMAHQYYCTPELSKEQIERFTYWMQGRIYLLDVYGMVKSDSLLELMEYGIKRFGCAHMMVDSIMKLDMKSDDYDLHRVVMNQMTTFAMNHRVHMHIVAHPRKGDSDKKGVGLLDVRGGGDLINQPDNVLSVFRNKRKEMAASAGRNPMGFDGKIIIEKQRATGVLGEIETKWHGNAQQYTKNRESERPAEWFRWDTSQ